MEIRPPLARTLFEIGSWELAVRRQRIPEKTVQQQIASTLRALGAAVYVIGHPSPNDGRMHRGTMQTPGLPDLLAFVPNRRAYVAAGACQEADMPAPSLGPQPLFIEVKAEGGRLSDVQRDFRTQCEKAGVAHVVGDLNAVIAWLLDAGVIREHQIPHYRLPAARVGA